MTLLYVAFVVIVALLLLLFMGSVLKRMWHRATPESAIIRTGGSKAYVTLTGGCLQIPVIHTISRVAMTTMKIDVDRKDERSLITKDRLRANAVVTFFTRVIRTGDGVLSAASSLGGASSIEQIKALIEPKFDDVIRAVGMSMTLSELLDQRDKFRQKILEGVATDLEKNGLELEGVSVTTLNQTDIRWFKEDNVIDAEGLTIITNMTNNRKQERNESERATEVAIAQRDLEASNQILAVNRTKAQATLEQEESIANLTAEQAARVASTQAEARRTSEKARIDADLEIKKLQIAAEASRELAEQERRIQVAAKSQDESAAEAKANEARATAVTSEQSIVTARDVAEAERIKVVAVVNATREADTAAVAIKVSAQAKREAAENEAAAVTIRAQAEAKAIELVAQGNKAKALAEADGQAALNAAENAVSVAVLEFRRALALIAALPGMLEAQAKPLEKLDSFKVVHFGGVSPSGTTGGADQSAATGSGGGDFTGNLLKQVQQYRLTTPIIDEALNAVGIVNTNGQLTVPGMKSMTVPASAPVLVVTDSETTSA